MKPVFPAAASRLALFSLLSVSPALGQGGYPAPNGDQISGDRVDTNGMPTTRSTPEEKAQTAGINNQVAAGNAAADAEADTNNANYQSQQQQYQRQQNQEQQDRHRDRAAAYEELRLRYAAERAAYYRGIWPDRYVKRVLVERDAGLIGANRIGERVEMLSGSRVGTVIDAAHAPSGKVEALLVRLDIDKIVWIDAADVRCNRADCIMMTDLDAGDLHHMADERL